MGDVGAITALPAGDHIVAGAQRGRVAAVILLAHGARQGHVGGADTHVCRADVQPTIAKADGVVAAGLPTGRDHVVAHIDRANGRAAVSEGAAQIGGRLAVDKAAVTHACSGRCIGRVSAGVIRLAVVVGLDLQRRCGDHPVCGTQCVRYQLVVGCIRSAQADA